MENFENFPSTNTKQEKFIAKTPEEELLESCEVETISPMKGGSNEVFFVKLKDDGEAIFKPKSGENKRLGMAGTQFQRERAAYLVDKFFDFGLVPPTVIRKINGEEGSIQRFIPNARVGREINEAEIINKRDVKLQLMSLCVFYYVICNYDSCLRKDFLIEENNVFGSDNGMSFHGVVDFKPLHLKQFFNLSGFRFEGAAAPEELQKHAQEILDNKMPNKKTLKDALTNLLRPGEPEACIERAEKICRYIAENGTLP